MPFFKRNKFRAIKTEVDGIIFDSKKEAKTYSELKLLERGKAIKDIRLQVPYEIQINGIKICKYVADFVYLDSKTGKTIVHDAKGMKTPVYNIKKKLMKAVLGIDIFES